MLQSTTNYSTTRSQLTTPVEEGRRQNWITHCQQPRDDEVLERGNTDKIPRVRTPFQVIQQGWRTVVGVPGRIVRQSGKRIDPLEHGQLPDTQAAALRALRDRITELEQQLASFGLANLVDD